MTTAEIIERLGQEKKFGSRFPARIIFVDNLGAYNTLVSKLKGVCDVTISLADFCKADDVVPQFDKLRVELSDYVDKHVLLLSLGEYLRLCIKREIDPERGQLRGFWELMQPETSRTRYILPVFCARDLFDRIVGRIDERQEDFVWTLDSSSAGESYTISVYSPQFAGTIDADAGSLKSWLEGWPHILGMKQSCSIITRQYKNVEATFGSINIKTIDSPFSYLQDTVLDVSSFQKEWLPEKCWTELAGVAKEGVHFSDIVLKALNINEFDFVSIAARWGILTDLSRSMVWLWYRAYPSEEYYSYACKKALSPDEIPEKIRDEILYISSRSAEWINQRMQAVKAFSFDSFSDSYFALLDTLPLPELKLQLLTYTTHEERAYAIKVISGLLRDGLAADAIADSIKNDYEALATYLVSTSGIDAGVDEYFAWYRKNKLINRFPGEPENKVSFDKFDSRFKCLNKFQGKDCFTFWIDGFGMEWMPAFIGELAKLNIIPENKYVATAILPTETEYNHQWNTDDPMSEKWGRLDSYSHKGMPDDRSYFSCIDYQLSVFPEAAKHVDELLDEHEYVAITGDHGSSRLAALAFHHPSIVPVAAPAKSTVRSYGRFCELADSSKTFIPLPGMEVVSKDGATKYVVMNDYQHFSVGGNVAGGNTDENDVIGEVHGGNTPEERLVPVIIVKRSHPLPPMTCTPQTKYVTKKNGRVETNLKFNRPVSSLEVSIGDNLATCEANPDGTWHVVMNSIPEEELQLSVVANGRLLTEKVIMKVKSQGIMKNDSMLGL